ncbi:acylase [Alteromonas genovensis]|uniref:Acylase n=1 Tax=Alteromonas genovensis TaxID=471225 RepID=A0A6N9TGV7_9ALTE|nr:penicillin acylase family protein [Alteromonas genovensis]NDW13948.1 acylase [Alteromonas genovensis]
MKCLSVCFAVFVTMFISACSSDHKTPAVDQATDNPSKDVLRWEATAKNVTITRDNWGIPHIKGKTDADAVFGMLYAQAEDDFNRIERNYINAMGRLAEDLGEDELYRDLRMKLFIQPKQIKKQYEESPQWLRKLMVAFADGLNYYLYTHPEVQPKVITRFEPWMALTFSEGSIGGDIERGVNMARLAEFYGNDMANVSFNNDLLTTANQLNAEPGGSNGFAIAPSRTKNGNALLLVNPHTSFYFRHEAHVQSEEGLNAYGASTWGQFFIYQGFNERVGWMHTSTYVDVIDEYIETVIEKEDGLHYVYGDEHRKLKTRLIELPYKAKDGTMQQKQVTAYFTHRGPIVRSHNGKWVSVRLMEEPVKALIQSYSRTKAQNYDEFYSAMKGLTNSSNNTVYADADGTIAYFHGNFVPRRNTAFDYTQPVDGSNPATDWQGIHPLEEHIHIKNPGNGWIQNTNNWPYSAAAEFSPKKEDYPAYYSGTTENYRGIHAINLLKNTTDFDVDSLINAAYDSHLTGFDVLLVPLFKAFESLPDSDPRKASLREPIATLQAWDKRSGEDSVPTSIAVFWGMDLMQSVRNKARAADVSVYTYMESMASNDERLISLKSAVDKLARDFGTWQTPWGEINRFQRISPDIRQHFDDDAPSLPVGFASGRWGALAAYGQNYGQGETKRIYGTRGNSFVAAVEFGEKLKAKAITAGGLSNDPSSPHYNDQAAVYVSGKLRDVYFYADDIAANAEETYQPGQR